MKIGITERGDAAIHAGEVYRRLKEGSFDGAVLITKNPASLFAGLQAAYFELPCPYIVHATITGYGGTALEPGVPTPDVSLDGYSKLVSELGPERVVLRVDPIIPTDKGVDTARSVIKHAQGRVRVSIFDAYPHALARMTPKMVSTINSVYHGEFHAPKWLRSESIIWCNEELQKAMKNPTKTVEVCGEPGLPCTGCVSQRDLDAMGITLSGSGKCGQRGACACIAQKTEILDHRGQCKHGCLYCFWK